jgi:cobalt-zinc-cadmium resistance protein CzcA
VYVTDRIYGATVRFPKVNKSSPETLGGLFLNSSTGAKITLAQVADISLKTGESTISHEASERQISVRIDNRGRDLISYLKEAQKKIDQKVKFDPQKFHLEWAGQFENQRRAQGRLIIILGVVVLLMAVLLFFQFGRVRLVGLILAVVPMATLGGLIAVHMTDETLNVATAVGFIALFGVAVQNGIIMIANIRRVSAEDMTLEEAVVEGATERLRPVLMTATVASFGMLPAALAVGVGTDVQRNLANVVVGGLGVATLLTLFILPTYYFTMERYFENKKWDTRPKQKP